MKRQIITLTTDFGTKDGYVGAVKGVIKRINPEVEIGDITHDIKPFNVLGAAFVLNNFYRYFPKNTIHLLVVDPGVGSGRNPLLIKSEDFFFVGPDNGVFSLIYHNERITDIIVLSNRKYFLAGLSTTFHARDIFAPVAAYLSLGVDIREFGATARECVKLILPQPNFTKKGIVGEIIHIDNFGNLITNIGAEVLENKSIAKIVVGKREIKRIAQSYFDIPKKELGLVMGSLGFIEIATNQENAQKLSKGRIGTPVKITFK
jgi:S-adenosylmethionine hydrolase